MYWLKGKSPTITGSEQLRTGQRIGRYELLARIGEGGMGTVWLTKLSGQQGFSRLYALKAILPKYSHQAEFRNMFLDEARLTARIDHPNVVQVFDFGEHQGMLYLIMEYVEGPPLRVLRQRAVERGHPLGLNLILRIAAEVCAGLHAAHELHDGNGLSLGLVHRDVSPDNVLVGRNGAVKLFDFGIAKAADRLSGDTHAGILKGKARYASPEQAIGAQLDRRSDLFSVGACLHELIANETPFDAPCELAILTRLTGGDAPNPLPPNVPQPVQELLHRCLARRPADRVPNADVLRRELEELMIQLDLRADRCSIGEAVQGLFGTASDWRDHGSREIAVTQAPRAARPKRGPPTHRTTVAIHGGSLAPYVLAGALGAASAGMVVFTQQDVATAVGPRGSQVGRGGVGLREQAHVPRAEAPASQVSLLTGLSLGPVVVPSVSVAAAPRSRVRRPPAQRNAPLPAAASSRDGPYSDLEQLPSAGVSAPTRPSLPPVSAVSPVSSVSPSLTGTAALPAVAQDSPPIHRVPHTPGAVGSEPGAAPRGSPSAYWMNGVLNGNR